MLRLQKQQRKILAQNTSLQNEVFGPTSLVVVCEDEKDLKTTLQALHGQLTASVIGTADDLKHFQSCIDLLMQEWEE